MRFLFFGAGAIGTYVGGSLALGGHTVVFTERPEPADMIAQTGLRLVLPEGEKTVRTVSVFSSAAEALAASEYDVGVFALKSFDTETALTSLKELDRVPPILCFQNGVDNEPLIERTLGPGRVIAGTVTSAVGKPGVGQVVLERHRGMGVAAGHVLSAPLAAALSQAGLNARLYPDPESMKWSKLLTNLIGNASSAILDLTVAEIFADRRLFDVEVRMLRECLAVMRALGKTPVDLPGTPVRALAWALRMLPRPLARPVLGRAVGRGRGGKMPSFHIDLHGGRGRTEVGWLNGAVVRHGAAHGVSTPVNRALNDTLEALSSGMLDQARFRKNREALLRVIDS